MGRLGVTQQRRNFSRRGAPICTIVFGDYEGQDKKMSQKDGTPSYWEQLTSQDMQVHPNVPVSGSAHLRIRGRVGENASPSWPAVGNVFDLQFVHL